MVTIFEVPLQLTEGHGRRVIGPLATEILLCTGQFPLEIEFVLDSDGQWRIRNY